ncbi:PREDICTED: V-set and transmembrane domain-containing protein 2-like protein, partial [Mandrillus leucophaeus]|uniref:V-set and transmembrane domain-containing protein 2-like protein n=1 Tax=Mandrillus leucophaeus TaxID=9568 RepID=UPI0005F53B39
MKVAAPPGPSCRPHPAQAFSDPWHALPRRPAAGVASRADTYSLIPISRWLLHTPLARLAELLGCPPEARPLSPAGLRVPPPPPPVPHRAGPAAPTLPTSLTHQLCGFLSPATLPPVSCTALFTETPHDMTARTGEDVEMACSFRGSGSPSYSLEIQWWYVRSHRDWTDKQAWASNQLKASQQEDAGKEATKISVVKVVGSNISHKLRLSRVKPTDEGTYECRVIDFSDGKARHHKVKAYLRVQPGENSVLH